jgi:2,3-bisphosphoglycerate-independent phosphoglycerate mutase
VAQHHLAMVARLQTADANVEKLFGIEKSAVISAVDLIQGIGGYAGMDVIKVEGAPVCITPNYEGKAKQPLRR